MDYFRCFGPRIFRFAALITCMMSFALGASALAGPEATVRRLKVGVRPEYPELARKLNIKGTVRIRLLIAPDGRIKNTKVLGGSPLLVQAVEEAVRKWRYEPASTESTEIVRFDFDPLTSAK